MFFRMSFFALGGRDMLLAAGIVSVVFVWTIRGHAFLTYSAPLMRSIPDLNKGYFIFYGLKVVFEALDSFF